MKRLIFTILAVSVLGFLPATAVGNAAPAATAAEKTAASKPAKKASKPDKIEVVADSFFADEKAGIADLKGSVEIKKGDSAHLWAAAAQIKFGKNKEPLSYEATGGTRFEVTLNGKKYKGSGTTLTYEPAVSRWTLKGAATLKELATDKEVWGEQIVVNQKDGTYSVAGSPQKPGPVRMIFSVEEK